MGSNTSREAFLAERILNAYNPYIQLGIIKEKQYIRINNGSNMVLNRFIEIDNGPNYKFLKYEFDNNVELIIRKDPLMFSYKDSNSNYNSNFQPIIIKIFKPFSFKGISDDFDQISKYINKSNN